MIVIGEIMKTTSSLQRRIAEGKAEPISDREREQLQELRKMYVHRFGKESDNKKRKVDQLNTNQNNHDTNSGFTERIKSGQADPVTDSQRAAAARIRVFIDEELGRETEDWIKELAQQNIHDKNDDITDSERASAARIQMILNKKLGRKTEDWIKELAQSDQEIVAPNSRKRSRSLLSCLGIRKRN